MIFQRMLVYGPNGEFRRNIPLPYHPLDREKAITRELKDDESYVLKETRFDY